LSCRRIEFGQAQPISYLGVPCHVLDVEFFLPAREPVGTPRNAQGTRRERRFSVATIEADVSTEHAYPGPGGRLTMSCCHTERLPPATRHTRQGQASQQEPNARQNSVAVQATQPRHSNAFLALQSGKSISYSFESRSERHGTRKERAGIEMLTQTRKLPAPARFSKSARSATTTRLTVLFHSDHPNAEEN
jgi:hypothetical protein